jgi:16S rRNA (guanine527-N7)-methyltransferase
MSEAETIEASRLTGKRLNALLAAASQSTLDAALTERFGDYCALLLRWNTRVNLTAIRDEEGILARHFVESIVCTRTLPACIATLLDFGSGAGFPGLPIALCRPEIAVTLAESQGKKAAFLREAVRALGLTTAVHSARAEVLREVFDCVALRAVDNMALAVQSAAKLVRPAGWLAMMTTRTDLQALQTAAGADFSWQAPIPQPGSDERLIALGNRSNSLRRDSIRSL